MIRGKCPICRKPFEAASFEELPSFPFCSSRCRLIDLGRWADGSYGIKLELEQPDSETPSGSPDQVDED